MLIPLRDFSHNFFHLLFPYKCIYSNLSLLDLPLLYFPVLSSTLKNTWVWVSSSPPPKPPECSKGHFTVSGMVWPRIFKLSIDLLLDSFSTFLTACVLSCLRRQKLSWRARMAQDNRVDVCLSITDIKAGFLTKALTSFFCPCLSLPPSISWAVWGTSIAPPSSSKLVWSMGWWRPTTLPISFLKNHYCTLRAIYGWS